MVLTDTPASASPASYVYLGLICNGLRALGIDEASLATFPEAFRAGMPARAQELGDHGASHPSHWAGGLASPGLHALLLLFAQDPAERARRVEEHRSLLGSSPGVGVLSELEVDLPATWREHFGYQDGITQVCVEGTGMEPPPGSGPAAKPGEFVLGYPDETGSVSTLPQPQWLTRNGSFLSYRRLYQDVAAFREFLWRNASTRDEQELLAAKLMGRWRGGAPWCWRRATTTRIWSLTRSAATTSTTARWTREDWPAPSARTSGASTRATRSPTGAGGG